MNQPLRIAVADDEPRMLEFYAAFLTREGHAVECTAKTGAELVAHCRSVRPDLVITDIKMPDLDGISAARQICQDEPIPIILVSAYFDAELVERAADEHILAYLVKPIKGEDLQPAVAIAMSRFAEFQAMRQEAVTLRQALQDRKLIERAKGLLMKWKQCEEAAAFKAMQKLARDKNRKLVEIADMILTMEEICGPAGEG